MTKTLSVAIVDDHAKMRKLLSGCLHEYGLTISLTAMHGKDLLSQLEVAETLPDTCLLDINMPTMDGFQTARALREKFPMIKILACSTNDYTDRIERMLNSGAHGFIYKMAEASEIRNGLVEVQNGEPFIRQTKSAIQESKGVEAKYPSVVFS